MKQEFGNDTSRLGAKSAQESPSQLVPGQALALQRQKSEGVKKVYPRQHHAHRYFRLSPPWPKKRVPDECCPARIGTDRALGWPGDHSRETIADDLGTAVDIGIVHTHEE